MAWDNNELHEKFEPVLRRLEDSGNHSEDDLRVF